VTADNDSGTDNVVYLDTTTTQDVPPERVLRAAIGADLRMAVVLGYEAETGQFYAASSTSNGPQTLWLLERLRLLLLTEAR
jgi:hypothetical protein